LRVHNAARRRDSSSDRPAAADNSFLIKSLHLAVAWVSYCSVEGSPYGS
jgi:hypothetical protein